MWRHVERWAEQFVSEGVSQVDAPSTQRDIAKLANGTMPHFLVHGKWPDGSVARIARQWIPECFNDAAVDEEARAAAIERYNGYMFAEADTSSEESCSEQGDEEEVVGLRPWMTPHPRAKP